MSYQILACVMHSVSISLIVLSAWIRFGFFVAAAGMYLTISSCGEFRRLTLVIKLASFPESLFSNTKAHGAKNQIHQEQNQSVYKSIYMQVQSITGAGFCPGCRIDITTPID